MHGVMDTFDKNDPEHDDDWEPWALKPDLHGQIVEHCKENPVPHIQVVEKEGEESPVEDWFSHNIMFQFMLSVANPFLATLS